jgi:hypothetical protein
MRVKKHIHFDCVGMYLMTAFGRPRVTLLVHMNNFIN